MTPQQSSAASQVIPRLSALLGVDPYLSSVETITNASKLVHKETRGQIISLCFVELSKPEIRKLEVDRVSLVKALVALVPDSFPEIKTLVRDSASTGISEVHFTLFCFLDDIQYVPGGSAILDDVLQLLSEYLLWVRSETGHAPWMAGDLLGDHWSLHTSIPVLCQAARCARYVAGRIGAVHGISHALQRADRGQKKTLMKLLGEISVSDRSARVRSNAESTLNECIDWKEEY